MESHCCRSRVGVLQNGNFPQAKWDDVGGDPCSHVMVKFRIAHCNPTLLVNRSAW